MNKLSIKKLNASAVEASVVPALMNEAGIEWNAIACVNCAEYPYQPEVKYRVAQIGDAILLHYQVTEASVRAVATADDGRVWEDACVEFFLYRKGMTSIIISSVIVQGNCCCTEVKLVVNVRVLQKMC